MKKLLIVFLLFSTPVSAQVQFDNGNWTGNVESQLRVFLSSGLAGEDGSNGQAVVNQMNALGSIYINGSFNPHHNGPTGLPTYGYPWFYVSYVPFDPAAYLSGTKQTFANSFYQIVKFGQPPSGDNSAPVNIPPAVPSVPQPQPALDLSSLARYDQAERIYADLVNRLNALDAKVADIQTEVHNPSWVKKLITNPVFVPVITAFSTWLVTCKAKGVC